LKVALSIAGSDSGAGAGIQADIKTFSALGVYAGTAITAITAQNTRRVSSIFPLPPKIVSEQIDSFLVDFSPSAIKIGMVYNKGIIDAVSNSLRKTKAHVVVDPVIAAGTGAALMRDDALDALITKLLPVCDLLTPNRMEAEKLAGMKISSENDAADAARKIKRYGARSVIVKGGHFGGREVVDVLLDSASRVKRISSPRIRIAESHGSGCNFSAAATAFLAKGIDLEQSCRRANEYVHHAISKAERLGKGLPVTNPLSSIYNDSTRYRVIEDLQRAVEAVSATAKFHLLIPETQTNFVYALPDASALSDVAGVRGRIVKIGSTSVPASFIEFGASTHMASAVLAYMAVRPPFRAAINIRHDDELVRLCRSLFKTSSYDRRQEPSEIKAREGSTMAWGISSALRKVPDADVIYHEGDIGKEAMINIFGISPAEVTTKIKRILKNYQ
jgi:hydroxymethylpyrimidine/phosphomethylpyrimidine kinase